MRKKKTRRRSQDEFDVITATADCQVVWRRYGDGLVVIAAPEENPQDIATEIADGLSRRTPRPSRRRVP